MNNQQGQGDPIFAAIDDKAVAIDQSESTNDDEPMLRSIPVVLLEENGSTSGRNTKAYYLSNDVKFRHEGISGRSPPCLYLRDLTCKGGKTLVYYSSSGSGKTSELAGSSATRGAHLAIVISIEDPIRFYAHFDNDYDPNTTRLDMELASPGSQDYPSLKNEAKFLRDKEKSMNMKAADIAITPVLTELFSCESVRALILPAVDVAVSVKKPLKLVLAIDEASSCPRVIRGILRFPKYLKECVRQALDKGLRRDLQHLELEVQLSIGGTGVGSSAIGSLPNNFDVLTPSHEEIWAKVVDSTLSTLKLSLAVPWNAESERFSSFGYIAEHLPVVSELMKNGRMASITLAELQNLSKTGRELKEGILAQAVVKRFIDSNGMSSLQTRQRPLVAASALAVHLFKNFPQFKITVPGASAEVAQWASDMHFFDFATDCHVKDLVQAYGLLEPSEVVPDSARGQSIPPPLQMTPPQQLVALFMLGLELDSMLDPTWFGFELMSTHLVKCAIAASLAVGVGKRPSVKDTLELVGFRHDAFATSDCVKTTWKELESLIAAPSRLQDNLCLKTRHLNAGPKIVQSEGGTVLQIEKSLKRALMGLGNGELEKAGRTLGDLVPPIACVNEGNSNLSDGFVSFLATRVTSNGGTTKVTIAIQAKDYHDQSRLDHGKLNGHAKTMANNVLEGVFGSLRLLCVASDSDSLFAAQPCAKKREYMPYSVQSSKLLGTMLAALSPTRSQSHKVAKYACHCDKEGREVPRTGKRKHADVVV